jgi:hypothetical protein
MSRELKEPDWRLFRQLQRLALERFSQGILDQIAVASTVDSKSYHQRYLDIFNLIQQRNEEMAEAFDNPRRSTAIIQLAVIVSHGWLTQEEFLRFGEETRNAVESFRDIDRD